MLKMAQFLQNHPLTVHGFSQNWPIFEPTKISKLNTQLERPY